MSEEKKQLPVPDGEKPLQEIKKKKSQKEEKLREAPDEVLAMAIRQVMQQGREEG